MKRRILWVDDEPEALSMWVPLLAELHDLDVVVVEQVEQAVRELHAGRWDLVVLDLFLPMGPAVEQVLGPRARRMKEQVQHLGGLVLLDEIERLAEPRPRVVSYTACTDPVLFDWFGPTVQFRLPKPAPIELLLARMGEVLAAGERGQ